LAVSRFVPHSNDAAVLFEQCRGAFDAIADDASAWRASARSRLAQLKRDCDQTTAAFEFESVLSRALLPTPAGA
jgi:hypothetical protein